MEPEPYGNFSHLNPLHYFNIVIDKLKHLPVEERPMIRAEIPNVVGGIKKAGKAVSDYHLNVFKSTSEWSNDLKLLTERVLRPIFLPISWCRFGAAIRDVIAKDLIGNTLRGVAFIALQVFHVLPYILLSALSSGVAVLSNTAPVALGACIGGIFLLSQIYFLYRLIKEIEVTNQILDQRLDEISRRFDVVLLIKNTGNTTWDMAKRTIRASARASAVLMRAMMGKDVGQIDKDVSKNV